jgi:DNA repair protein RadA/Sms
VREKEIPKKATYSCQQCGNITTQWAGKCSACGEWNSIVEESAEPIAVAGQKSAPRRKRSGVALETFDGEEQVIKRYATNFSELDLVTGGGLVPGSAVLVGGDPGIGKSTLLTQLAANLANQNKRVLYFSGEEATAQVRLRADRLGVKKAKVELAAETNLEAILATISEGDTPSLCIIDSIQTLWTDTVDAAPGTVTQLRATTHSLIRLAKKSNICLILVGHVTKEGAIAGPKVIEHMVDTVLYFEGERGAQFRILRAQKNRFGPTDEIGVFEMRDNGLNEVTNPSEIFLSNRNEKGPGTSVFAGIEGTRPVLVEIQALVAPSPFGTPRRAVIGWDSGRLNMILAVLESRCGIVLGKHDVYLNIAGGMKINEPAADLAAAAALMSAFVNKPLPDEAVFFGEISLSGGIRRVSHTSQRLREAEKLGFSSCFIPENNKQTGDVTIRCQAIKHLSEIAKIVS